MKKVKRYLFGLALGAIALTNLACPQSPGSEATVADLQARVSALETQLAALAAPLTDTEIAAMGYIKTYTETDPTVNTAVKDGVSWNEVLSIPAGFADGTDDSALDPYFTVETGDINKLAGPHIIFTGANIQTNPFQDLSSPDTPM